MGFRHASPYLPETLEKMMRDGVKKVRALIMAPHQSEASWDRYHRALQEAGRSIKGSPPNIDFVQPFFNDPRFIKAVTARAQEVLTSLPKDQSFTLLFTAHSIPVKMAETSPYVDQVTTSARLVAEKLNQDRWKVAFQSRSGDLRIPWLAPDICDTLRSLAKEGERCVVIVPVGFLSEHVEILYDLDLEARGVAEEVGIRFIRAKTVGDHPEFTRMMSECLLQEPVAEGV
ncbi:ferrochelatase [candidate division TA06 bacterium]|nr:ferrochelatase [candidate division TA06 bacterium]